MADMVKMYRAIWIHPDDRPFQSIYWRASIFDPVQTYQLNTVTYGLTSSPYQALRTIRQLCIDEGDDFSDAAKILQRDVFVDDIVTGADTFEKADRLKHEIIALLKRGNFVLSKWASNDPRLISDLIDVSPSPVSMAPKDDHAIKILGLMWNPQLDCFQYKIQKPSPTLTKPDPGETEYLSPGRFLIGQTLLTPPSPSYEDLKLNTLDRWQFLKRTCESFWKRWRLEYLSTLQSRAKWTKSNPNIAVGTLVLLKDSNIPVFNGLQQSLKPCIQEKTAQFEWLLSAPSEPHTSVQWPALCLSCH
ncbi:unnamed protein product [Nesidiocoris tenuis]|uniref:DUF5641 domain-containing protein n=1 Tax=Nesidiocoris tenuis TaxID=355587 RepID=A0A6H5GK48_9HEMI|nr:unnamed protein product [Nesidiocoris tenuis]